MQWKSIKNLENLQKSVPFRNNSVDTKTYRKNNQREHSNVITTLHAFNIDQREVPKSPNEAATETKRVVQQRLLFNRTTVQTSETAPQILYQG